MRTERRRVVAAMLGALSLGVAALAPRVAAAAPGFDLDALMGLLGRVKSGEATFIETRRIEMLDRTLDIVGASVVQGARRVRPRDAEAAPRNARRPGQHADDEPRRTQPDDAARRLARGLGDRRGDPRHADGQSRARSSACSRPRSREMPASGRSSSSRATCACAARSRRCASPARNRSPAKCACCSPTATTRR